MITKTDMCFIIDKIDSLDINLPTEVEEIISDVYLLFAHELYEYSSAIINDYNADKNKSESNTIPSKREYDNSISYSEDTDDTITVNNTKKQNTRKNSAISNNSVAKQFKQLME